MVYEGHVLSQLCLEKGWQLLMRRMSLFCSDNPLKKISPKKPTDQFRIPLNLLLVLLSHVKSRQKAPGSSLSTNRLAKQTANNIVMELTQPFRLKCHNWLFILHQSQWRITCRLTAPPLSGQLIESSEKFPSALELKEQRFPTNPSMHIFCTISTQGKQSTIQKSVTTFDFW